MLFQIFSPKESGNIFTTLLKELDVKHTKSFSDKYYNEHPYKNTLYGLSKMLSYYNVENQGIKAKDKSAIVPELETPFIAYVGNDFVTVTGINDNRVDYIWENKKISVPIEEFINLWSGVTLLTETTENSIEPDYKEHHKQEFISVAKQGLLIMIITLFSGLITYSNQIHTDWKTLTSLFINIAGIYICYLLLLKQMHIHSRQADKICSLLIDKSDCNHIMGTDAAKIMGFGWSEIGLGYFMANVFIIICFPSSYGYVTVVNICTLPYTIWSIWYQKFKAKQWCPLCLIVQGLLWLLFIANLSLGGTCLPVFDLNMILMTACMYILPVLLLNMSVPYWSAAGKTEQVMQSFNSLKSDENIFRTLLEAQPEYNVEKNSSSILWGNSEAKNLITVITNPHCNPCAMMHTRLTELLKETNNGYCIQYILASFNEDLEKSSKLFIAVYQQNDLLSFLSFLEKWYDKGKNKREEFYKKYPFDEQDDTILRELQRHKLWLDVTKIRSTPAILFNGYELPDRYQVEDLKYFADI
jgi:thiol-disulfide isomerase/thioredoxin